MFREVYELRGARPLLAQMPRAVGGKAPVRSDLRAALAGLTPDEQRRRLRTEIRQIVARTLKLPVEELDGPRREFAALGVDWLLALDIRNQLAAQLGLELAATLVFDHPDLERLTAHLLAQWPVVAVPLAAPVASARAAAIATLSEAEVEELLRKKLESL